MRLRHEIAEMGVWVLLLQLPNHFYWILPAIRGVSCSPYWQEA